MKWEMSFKMVIDDEETEDEMLRLDTASDFVHKYLAPIGGISDVQAFAFRLLDHAIPLEEDDEE